MLKHEKKQGFREVHIGYPYKGEVKYIPVSSTSRRLRRRRSEEDVILWDDILLVYNEADHIQLGDTAIPFEKDKAFNVLEPKRISIRPGVILDVITKKSSMDGSVRSFGMSASASSSDRSVLVSSPVQDMEMSRSPSTTTISDKAYNRMSGHSLRDNSTSYSRPTSPLSPTFNHPPISRHSIHGDTIGNHSSYCVHMCSAPIGNVREFAVERPSSSLEQISRSESRSSYMSQDYRQDIILTPVQMKDLFQSRADRGDPEAQNSLGMLYEKGSVVEKADNYKALEWYLRSAEQGNPSAQNNLGLMYFEGKGVPQNYTQAKIWFQRAADRKHADAMYNIGRLYDNGLGVPRDYYKAMSYYEEAVRQGHTDAQTNVGVLHELGRVNKRDYVAAMNCYLQAANKGNFIAETRMGKLFCQDRGGKNRDYKKALRCFTNAAHHDYAPALEMLGKIYYNGWGVQRNFDIAKEWFQKAADYGQSSAHNMLGTMYLRGEGGSKDFIKATEHYRKAAAQGDSSGVDNLQYSRQKKYILKAWCSM